MGGVSSTDQEPGEASAGTMEPTASATRSYSLSTDTPPEVTHIQKPEVAHKSVITQQPTALAPFSQIQAGGRALFPTSDHYHEEPSNRTTVAAYCPFHTGSGNRNSHDVTQKLVEAESYMRNITDLSLPYISNFQLFL